MAPLVHISQHGQITQCSPREHTREERSMSKILGQISRSMPWLDATAGVLKQVVEPILGPNAPKALKDTLYGTWLGHPLHPAMTDVPVGCWTATAAFDLIGQEQAADATLKLGVLGALGSAITGAAQWYDLQEMEEPRRLGALHATLNTGALGLYVASWMLRDRGLREAGIATAMAGYAIASSSAWIGGHLSFVLGIGVSRNAFEEPPAKWRTALPESDLAEGELKRVEVRGNPVVLLKQGDRIYATSAVCTHVGGPLDEGELNGTCVTCPWHGSEFDLRSGEVVHGPATVHLHAYETRVSDGNVQVRLKPDA
jgi:nitrite reductase/ring-hydroxylating ferredoxin subunit/uncharacterized membrane protein